MAERHIQAVETRYKGYHFRSRAEARWAVFFDAMGIKYEYEQDKFEYGDERYIPDFFLPEMDFDPRTDSFNGVYFEVKGPYPTQAEITKAGWLFDLTRKHTYIFHGAPFDGTGGLYVWGRVGSAIGKQVSDIVINQCPLCGQILFVFASAPEESPALVPSHACIEEYRIAEQHDVSDSFMDWQDLTTVKIALPIVSPMMALALQAAKSARFEDPNYLVAIDGMKAAVQTLREQRVWCGPEIQSAIVQVALELRADPNCPRYDGAPWYVGHVLHLRAGGAGPCPCYSCEYKRGQQ